MEELLFSTPVDKDDKVQHDAEDDCDDDAETQTEEFKWVHS